MAMLYQTTDPNGENYVAPQSADPNAAAYVAPGPANTVSGEPLGGGIQAAEPPAAVPKVTFTDEQQAAINQMVGNARVEGRNQAPNAVELSEMNRKVAAYDASEEANKTDIQKATDEATVQKERADTAQGRVNGTLVGADIRVRAVQKGIIDPDAAVKLIDLGMITVSDDGIVSGTDEALDALLVKSPYLKGSPNLLPPNVNAGGVTAAAKPASLSAEQNAFADALGVQRVDYAAAIPKPGEQAQQ